MTILNLSDGFVTADLVWNNRTNRRYILARDEWAPVPAALRRSELGGRGPYVDAVEEIVVHVCGEDQREVLANLANLAQLLDQAERWARGDSVQSVRMTYLPTGGTTPGTAMVMGRAPGDETAGVSLPISFNSRLNCLMIEGVKLRFKRRGQFLSPSESAASGSAANPSVLSVTMPSAPTTHSPLDVRFSGFGSQNANTFNLPSMFLLIAASGRGATDLCIGEAEGMTATGYTSVADATAVARGGSVLRYTPTGTTLAPSGQLDLTTISGGSPLGGKRIACFAAVRNNSGTTSFLVNLLLTWAGAQQRTVQQLIDTSTLNPRVIALGSVVFPQSGAKNAVLEIQATAASGTLDIDYLVFLNVDDEMSAVIAIPPQSVSGLSAVTDMGISIETNILSGANAGNPWVRQYDGTSPQGWLTARGIPFPVSAGTTICGMVLATGGPLFDGRWAYSNGAGVRSLAMTCTRYPGELAPQ